MTDTREVINPGHYVLKSLTIQSAVGLKSAYFDLTVMDIAPLVPSISITSSIEQTSITGSFKVLDTVGLLENFPLRGEERAQIKIQDSFKDDYTFDVFCYMIDDVRTTEENNLLTYTIFFTSYQSFFASKTEIVKAYKEKTVTDIVNDIFNEHFNPTREARPNDSNFSGRSRETTAKNIIVYPGSDGLIRCAIPRLKPDQAMLFLAKRAYSELSRSSSYRFFENNSAYYFATDDGLFDVAVQRNRVFNFTYFANVSRTSDNFNQLMDNLVTLTNTKRVNTIDDMFNGTYRNKIYVLDILKRNVDLNAKGYNYADSKGLYFGTESVNVDDRHTKEFSDIFLNESIQKRFLLVKNYMDEDTNADAALSGNMYLDEIGSNRIAFKKHIESITVNAAGPGRLDISAGDVIDLNVPEFKNNTENKEPDQNKQLSGKYIVKSVTHTIDSSEVMQNSYVLIKREWSSVADNIPTNIGIRDLVNEIERGI